MNYQSYIIKAAIFNRDPGEALKKSLSDKDNIAHFGDLIDLMVLRQKVLMQYQTTNDILTRRRKGNLLKLIQGKVLDEFFEATNNYLAAHGSNEEAFIAWQKEMTPDAPEEDIRQAFREMEEVTAGNIKLIDRITKAQMSGHINDQIVAYEQFLGAVHNEGPLIDYLFDDYDSVEIKKFLDYLSNMSAKQLKLNSADQDIIESLAGANYGTIIIKRAARYTKEQLEEMGFEFDIVPGPQAMVYVDYKDQEEIAYAPFVEEEDHIRIGRYAETGVYVSPEYRRMGIATVMYDIISEYYGGKPVRPEKNHTSDAAKFWAQRE